MINEADTCRKYVLPKLYAAGWNDDQISEQKSFTDGRIVPVGPRGRRKPCKRADYLLRYARDFMLAVVEAKAAYRLPGDGLQQAKDYAATLGLKFAYSTNGHGIIEFDFTTGKERNSIHFQTDFAPARKSQMSKPQTGFWLRPTRRSARASATTRKSPSTASFRRCCRAKKESCSLWPLVQAKLRWLSRSAGSSGTCVGTARANTGGRKSCIWRTGTFW